MTTFDEKVCQSKQWFFVVPDRVLNSDQGRIERLKHPRSRDDMMVLFSDGRVYELCQFNDAYQSWLTETEVHENGRVYLTTPLDPIFLVLPYAANSEVSNAFRPLDQIITDDITPDFEKLLNSVGDLNSIFDCKKVDDLHLYRYNEDKTLTWLESKVGRTANKLKQERVQVAPGFTANSFVPGKKDDTAFQFYERYSLELIRDYLSDEIGEKLMKRMGIEELKRERETENETAVKKSEPPSKKAKLEPKDDYFQPLKQKQNLTSSTRKIDKIDKTGMKSLDSFFSVKPKKSVE